MAPSFLWATAIHATVASTCRRKIDAHYREGERDYGRCLESDLLLKRDGVSRNVVSKLRV